MSISPPSDIVLDVARAADPARYSQAAAKLSKTAAANDDFAEFLKTSAPADTAKAPVSKEPAVVASTIPTKPAHDAKKTYEDFEAMTLASLIEDAMPKDAGSFYGSGMAGNVWKSMLAEQLGKQMAKAGGIGLATQLARSAQGALAAPAAGTSGAEPGEAAKSMLVSEAERGFLSTLAAPGRDDTDTTT